MSRYESQQKARILQAAVGVFAERGLEGASTRLVAGAAGVNSALLYYYFENKEALFAETVTMVLREFLSHLRVRRRPFRGAWDRLQFLVDGVFDYYARLPQRRKLMGLTLSRHPELLGRALNRIISERDLVPIDVVAEGMRRGELRRGHPVEVWWNIIGMCLFSLQVLDVLRYVSTVPAGRLPLDLNERKKQILNVLLEGCATDKAMNRRNTRKDAR